MPKCGYLRSIFADLGSLLLSNDPPPAYIVGQGGGGSFDCFFDVWANDLETRANVDLPDFMQPFVDKEMASELDTFFDPHRFICN